MSLTFPPRSARVVYPESDGKPMADNTLQFRYIVMIKEGLEALFTDDPNVFVAGDLLWYPVLGNNRVRMAPDAMVVFGRPKGERGSYRQFDEDDIAPQVVFEILSPGNRAGEMASKHLFYERYGVEEYYIYDPDNPKFTAFVRSQQTDRLEPCAPSANGTWASARLGVRFRVENGELTILRPDGEPFKTATELMAERNVERQRAEKAETRVKEAETRAKEAETRAAYLARLLREAGIDPDGP